MRRIPLTGGFLAVVDDEDYERLSRYSWRVKIKGHGSWLRQTYAITGNGQTSPVLLMHRMVLRAPSDMTVDHIDGNGLNNRRSNLRLATQQQQGMNRRKSAVHNGRAPSSQFKGVSFDRRRGLWRVRIKRDRRLRELGRFARERDAALAYDQAAKELFGTMARLNFSGGFPCSTRSC